MDDLWIWRPWYELTESTKQNKTKEKGMALAPPFLFNFRYIVCIGERFPFVIGREDLLSAFPYIYVCIYMMMWKKRKKEINKLCCLSFSPQKLVSQDKNKMDICRDHHLSVLRDPISIFPPFNFIFRPYISYLKD